MSPVQRAHASRRLPLARLGEAVAKRPWVAVGSWVAALLVAVGFALFGIGGQNLFDRLSTNAFTLDSESQTGQDLLASDTDGQSVTLLVHGVALDDPALRDGFAKAAADAAAVGSTVTTIDPIATVWDQVAQAQQQADAQALAAAQAKAEQDTAAAIAAGALPSGTPAPTVTLDQLPAGTVPAIGWDDVYPRIDDPSFKSLIAADGKGALLVANIAGQDGKPADRATITAVIDSLTDSRDALRTALPDATVEVGSEQQLVDSITAQSEQDLQTGETIALPIALIIMLIVFGGFIAAGIPLLGAGASIAGGIGILFALTYAMDINSTVINVVTAVGLGLSIDYGLLMVSRFREEFRRYGGTPTDPRALKAQVIKAVGRTVDTAGRTALFSGTVFAIASAGLLLFQPTIVKALGLGALLVAAIGVVSAATLTPAVLALTGRWLVKPGLLTRIPGGIGRALTRFGDVAPEEGVFSKLTRLVQRAPIVVTILCAGGLIALGSPIATLQIANTSVDVIPESSVVHGFFETLDADFPAAATARVAIVARDEATVNAWAADVEGLPHVVAVDPAVQRGQGWVATVEVDNGTGVQVVPEVRSARPAGVEGWVTGQDASTYDLGQSLAGTAPWAMLMIGIVTVIFLFMATGSFIVPLKALAMSALSLSAAIGVLVWGFEQGNLAGIMHFDASQIHGVDVVVLLLALVFGFGLAMDYEMFILSRIIDLLHSGVPPKEAIARGLQRSGRIITSAALIIIIVFGGFATGELPVIKGLGVALASAVLLDATIVRMLLVPALMTWGEKIMFWAPKWAKRLHARIGLSEGS